MTEKMNVYLQYPWKFPDSPYYKYLLEESPKGINYLSNLNQKGVITNKKFFWFSNFLKRNIRRLTELFKFNIPNAHLSPVEDYDLIHCAHCLSKNLDKPWVSDIEMIASLAISGMSRKKGQRKVKKILMRENCKKILPWTDSTKKELLKLYPELEKKVETVYPAIPLGKKLNLKDGKIRILYATRYFWLKGGLIALEVLSKLKKKYGEKVEITFISDIESPILQKRYPLVQMKNLVKKEEMEKLYSTSDIYFYPSFVDTFGFGILEALSYGLPIVSVDTANTLSRKELIDEGLTGFITSVNNNLFSKIMKSKENLLLDSEVRFLINQIFSNCCKFIDDEKLREKMSNNCIKVIKEGKFSIKERNKQLKRIYEEALK